MDDADDAGNTDRAPHGVVVEGCFWAAALVGLGFVIGGVLLWVTGGHDARTVSAGALLVLLGTPPLWHLVWHRAAVRSGYPSARGSSPPPV